MLQLARKHRARRAGEWTEAKAVTFIVTLAASRSVTLAAARAGMSRKAAYALKRRDSGFAAAWNEALTASARRAVQGDKVHEVHDPRIPRPAGCANLRGWDRPFDAHMRDLFFATISNHGGDSGSLARDGSLP